jgi:hypothetical protein
LPPEISNLLFADDTLTRCDAYHDQIHNLGHILLCFKAISSLKVNLQKFELVTVGEILHKEELADILSCSISFLPLKYLGLPLNAFFLNKKPILDRLVENMRKRLASQKKIYLSGGGHLTLIKSTLSNLPKYFLSLFPLPAGIIRRLGRL